MSFFPRGSLTRRTRLCRTTPAQAAVTRHLSHMVRAAMRLPRFRPHGRVTCLGPLMSIPMGILPTLEIFSQELLGLGQVWDSIPLKWLALTLKRRIFTRHPRLLLCLLMRRSLLPLPRGMKSPFLAIRIRIFRNVIAIRCIQTRATRTKAYRVFRSLTPYAICRSFAPRR